MVISSLVLLPLVMSLLLIMGRSHHALENNRIFEES
jgi:hypothetical protein